MNSYRWMMMMMVSNWAQLDECCQASSKLSSPLVTSNIIIKQTKSERDSTIKTKHWRRDNGNDEGHDMARSFCVLILQLLLLPFDSNENFAESVRWMTMIMMPQWSTRLPYARREKNGIINVISDEYIFFSFWLFFTTWTSAIVIHAFHFIFHRNYCLLSFCVFS